MDDPKVLEDRIADLEARLIEAERLAKCNRVNISQERKRALALSLGIIGLFLAIQGIEPGQRSDTIKKVIDQALPVLLGALSAGALWKANGEPPSRRSEDLITSGRLELRDVASLEDTKERE